MFCVIPKELVIRISNDVCDYDKNRLSMTCHVFNFYGLSFGYDRLYSYSQIKDASPNLTIQNIYFDSENIDMLKTLLKNNKNIRKLVLCDKFNECVEGMNLVNLTAIEFGFGFNKSIDNLPDNIESLKIEGNFRQQITRLPRGLKKLYLDCDFDETVVELLPRNIECLELYPDKPLNLGDKLMSLTLKKLTLWDNVGSSFFDFVPNSVNELEICGSHLTSERTISFSVPKSVRSLYVNYFDYGRDNLLTFVSSIPSSVISLTFLYFDRNDCYKCQERLICYESQTRHIKYINVRVRPDC